VEYEKIIANLTNEDNGTVGEPGLAESLIPVWGSGRSAVHHFQKGNWGRGLLYTALAVSDVFLLKSIFTAGGKLLLSKEVAAAATKEATENIVKNKAMEEVASGVVHLTSKAKEKLITESGKVGSRWGIFGLNAGRVPSSQLGRTVTTLATGSLSGEIKIGARAAQVFARPPRFGLFSLGRYFAGVRSTPLGSLVLHTSESLGLRAGQFLGGEIFIGGAFRMATRGEYALQLSHQWLLDYGFDALLYSGAKVELWASDLSTGEAPPPLWWNFGD
jgi:hypothetical protein